MSQSSADAEKGVGSTEGETVLAHNLTVPVDSGFPEGGWAGWASVIGACVVRPVLWNSFFLTRISIQGSGPVRNLWVCALEYCTLQSSNHSPLSPLLTLITDT
jgi:hypothetical protein